MSLLTCFFITSTNAFLFHNTKHRASSVTHQAINPTVQVFDNTFSAKVCEELHYLAVEHNERTSDGSSVFLRPPHNDKPLTPIEHAIDSALIEIGDTARLVEYWSRDEYMNIDAHADIDEAMLEDEGAVRCPSVGHVLYLQVKQNLRGPTCVFPYEKIGWGLDEEIKGDKKELVIVPAVEGRILRFPGSAMHAVPNPPDRWLLDKFEESALRASENDIPQDIDVGDKGEWIETEEEEEDFDRYDDEDEVERSVLLFNTWQDGEPGPKGVNGDIATGALPEGIELNEDDAASYLKSQEAQILADWEEEFGENGQLIRCNPFLEWKSIEIEETEGSKSRIDDAVTFGEFNVSLMGMQNRRLYSEKYARLKGPKEVVKKALFHESKVSLSHLVKEDVL